jgi:hypothetical protein
MGSSIKSGQITPVYLVLGDEETKKIDYRMCLCMQHEDGDYLIFFEYILLSFCHFLPMI